MGENMDLTYKDVTMKKTISYIFLFLFFPIFLDGCSLFSSDEKKTMQTSEDSGTEGVVDDGDNSDMGADPSGTESYEEGDLGTEESFGSGSQEDEYQDDEYAVNNETSELPGSPMTDNQEQDLFNQQSVDTSLPFENNNFSPSDQMNSMADRPKLIPVKKMKSSVYQASGVNLNRLYIVRPDDNMQSIATKIYGNDRSEELYSYNLHFRGKNLNTGDKIYYQSPNNPNDSMMKTYYEDNNLPPQYYTTQEGDNLRKFSKKLLGHERSWMEIYATNENVESKGRLPAGLQIRYWPDMPGMTADNSNSNNGFTEEPMPVNQDQQNVVMDQNQPPQPENPDMGNPADNMNNTETAQMGDVQNINDPQMNGQNLPPPPPVPTDMNNQPTIEPAAPPSPVENPVASENNSKSFTEDEKLMVALCGLMFVVAIILLILIRRNRSRKVNFGHTQS